MQTLLQDLRFGLRMSLRKPALTAVGVINDLPVTGQSSVNGDFCVEGQPPANSGEAPLAEWRFVTPTYFTALGIAIRQGRAFSARATLGTPVHVMINESLAQRFFPNHDALGKRLLALDGQPHEIIGIVGDARQWGLSRAASPEVYFSSLQVPFGLYGVMSYVVSQSARELGIRLALGAQARDVLRLVVLQGMVLAGAGIVIGVAAGLGLTRLLTSLLFGIAANDPLTFAALATLLALIALLACYIPARRATKVDPLLALRCE